MRSAICGRGSTHSACAEKYLPYKIANASEKLHLPAQAEYAWFFVIGLILSVIEYPVSQTNSASGFFSREAIRSPSVKAAFTSNTPQIPVGIDALDVAHTPGICDCG